MHPREFFRLNHNKGLPDTAYVLLGKDVYMLFTAPNFYMLHVNLYES